MPHKPTLRDECQLMDDITKGRNAAMSHPSQAAGGAEDMLKFIIGDYVEAGDGIAGRVVSMSDSMITIRVPLRHNNKTHFVAGINECKRLVPAQWVAQAALQAKPDSGWKAPQYLVWWTDQVDCNRITKSDKYHLDWPDYLRNEFGNRLGRNGRGRLWVPTGIPIKSVPWNDKHPCCKWAADCGGVVIHATDAKCVEDLPGFLTTVDMIPFPAAPAHKE